MLRNNAKTMAEEQVYGTTLGFVHDLYTDYFENNIRTQLHNEEYRKLRESGRVAEIVIVVLNIDGASIPNWLFVQEVRGA